MADRVSKFFEAACEKLYEIEALLTTGAKMTLIARHPGHPDQDIMITSDDYGEIIALINRRMGRDALPSTKLYGKVAQ